MILLLAIPSAWLLGRELAAVKAELGVGREARIRTWRERVEAAGDPWRRWKYCQEILDLERENSEALSWKEKIAHEYARQAREMKLQGRTREAISTLVLAIRVNPQVGYLWIWMEDWIRDWVEENRAPRATPRPAAVK